MLTTLHHLACKLQPLRSVSLVFGLIGLLGILLSLLLPTYSPWLLPALLLLLWSLLAYSFLTLFRVLPEHNPQAGLRGRLQAKLGRFAYWLLGGFFILLTLGILGVTLRGLIIFWRG